MPPSTSESLGPRTSADSDSAHEVTVTPSPERRTDTVSHSSEGSSIVSSGGQLPSDRPQPNPTAPLGGASPDDQDKTTSLPPAQLQVTVECEGAVLGQYLLISKIGQGGMGSVWKALHLKLEKHVALKLLPKSWSSDPVLLSRFEREMKAVGKLEHPHIVRAMDAGEHNGHHYLVMELIEGDDLSAWVKKRGPQKVADACEMLRHAAQGLAHAHANGLVHRDVKPSNLFLTKAGKVKVLDLGLARVQGDAPAGSGGTITGFGQVLGTPDFMAPEQWENTHTVDARCDLYALGCTLFFLLTGQAPYSSGKHNSLVSKMKGHTFDAIPDLSAARQVVMVGRPKLEGDDISPEVNAIYRKLMSKRPDDRFSSASELVKALEPYSKSGIAKALDAAKSIDSTRQIPPIAVPVAMPVKRPLPVAATEVFPVGPVPTENDSSSPTIDFLDQLAHAAKSPERPRPNETRSPRSSRQGTGRSTSRRKLWLSVAAAVIVLGVIIITITNKDGTKTKIEVAEGSKIEITTSEISNLKSQISNPKGSASKFPLLAAGWFERVSKLPPEEQVKEVSLELKRRNPEWDEKLEHQIRDDYVLQMRFDSTHVSDIAPLAVLTDLRNLLCTASKPSDRLTDLSPLAGLKQLKAVYFTNCTSLSDLSALRGLTITDCSLQNTSVTDLSPLAGMLIQFLELSQNRNLTDLSPLKGAPLNSAFGCLGTGVRDLSPLRDSQVKQVMLHDKQFDPDIVCGWPLKSINFNGTRLSVPLDKLLRLKEIKTLETIDDQPVAEFWKEFDQQAGWLDLFNGRDLTGWKRVGEQTWKVSDGVLSVADTKPGMLLTEKPYTDFDLMLEFKLPARGNSGLYLRTDESGDFFKGVELQLCDDATAPAHDQTPLRLSGALYDVAPRIGAKNVEPNRWHELLVQVRGDRVTVTLNGELRCEAEPAAFRAALQAKGKHFLAPGRIGLQAMSHLVEFRKLRIRDALKP